MSFSFKLPRLAVVMEIIWFWGAKVSRNVLERLDESLLSSKLLETWESLT